jgi:hypothetical protein
MGRLCIERPACRRGDSSLLRHRDEYAEDAREWLFDLALLPLEDALLEKATSLEAPVLRSLDAIHLATALIIRDDLGAFFTYDERRAPRHCSLRARPRRRNATLSWPIVSTRSRLTGYPVAPAAAPKPEFSAREVQISRTSGRKKPKFRGSSDLCRRRLGVCDESASASVQKAKPP